MILPALFFISSVLTFGEIPISPVTPPMVAVQAVNLFNLNFERSFSPPPTVSRSTSHSAEDRYAYAASVFEKL
jgi:hypothetical protein